MPKISVLIPLYKPNPVFLQETLECLVNQTEQDFECIICEEPTDEDALSILRPFLEDSRFSHHRNEKCLGIGGNWNQCLSYVTCDTVAYLFQDDLWEPNYLEEGLKILEQNPSVGFVSMGHSYKYEGGTGNEHLYDKLQKFREQNVQAGVHSGTEFLKWWIEHELHPNIIGEPPFILFRKSLMEEVGPFNEHMPQFLDVEYSLRCLQKSDWYNCPGNYGQFRVHIGAASADNERSGAGIYDRLQCFEELIAKLDGSLKSEAIKARNSAIDTMVQKYFARKKEGKSMKGKSSGALKKFCLRHPIVITKAIIRALFQNNKSANI